MKLFKNIFSICLVALVAMIACKKDEMRAVFSGGTAPTLSVSAPNLNMVPADSNANVFTFNWTDPGYSVSNSTNTLNVNYVIEVDSATKNFANAKTVAAVNSLNAILNGRTLNKLLLDLGYTDSAKVYTLQARLKASLYVASSQVVSNTINFTVSPYSTKPTAKYPVPDNLYIVGDATAALWANPVPVPSQQFYKVDEFTFGGIFNLTGGKKYLLLPDNGSWNKYAVTDNTIPGLWAGGDFIVNAGQDIPGPAASGWYKIMVNFVTGKYTVTAVPNATDRAPDNLFIVGDAVPGLWANPVPLPSQQFTKTSSVSFELIIPLTAAKKYLLLPTNGIWDKYAVADNTVPSTKEGGSFVTNTGQDIPSPDVTGTYKIEVEFINRTYKVTKQ